MPQRSNSARYLWGDRNPVQASTTYNPGGIAPHASTIRTTYTVPTGKKARVFSQLAYLEIESAAAPAGRKSLSIYVVSGGTTYHSNRVMLPATSNAIGNSDRNILGEGYTLYAAEQIIVATADLGTGGTVAYVGTILTTEYDA